MSTYNKRLEGQELRDYVATRFPEPSKRVNTVGTHKTSIVTLEGMTNVVYHNTAVVQFNNDKIVLNSGGWDTRTTKTRMNQASSQYGLGFEVYQVNFSWYVDYDGDTIPFTDGMILDR